MTLSMLAMLGTPEIIIIGIVILVLFGARKVPELMKGVGTGIREFKKASKDVQEEISRAAEEDPEPVRPKKPVDTVSQGTGSEDKHV